MGLEIPYESNPLKSRSLVRRLAVMWVACLIRLAYVHYAEYGAVVCSRTRGREHTAFGAPSFEFRGSTCAFWTAGPQYRGSIAVCSKPGKEALGCSGPGSKEPGWLAWLEKAGLVGVTCPPWLARVGCSGTGF